MRELKDGKKVAKNLVGYMVYKFKKCINFYLFSTKYSDVEEYKNQGYQIAKVYEGNIYELEDGRYFQEV